MKIGHIVFLDSVSFLPFLLRKLPVSYSLSASKSCYHLCSKTEENLNYVGPIPDISYYGVNKIG